MKSNYSLLKDISKKSNFDVVVIGAGAAGLAATNELINKGKSVLCIEAMGRIGGRCHTDHSIFASPFDIGAHWLHSYSGNQIAKYGRKYKKEFKIYKVKENTLVYEGRKKVSKTNLFKIIDEIKVIRDKFSEQEPLIKNKAQNDIAFINLLPKNITENEWFDTAHQTLGPCLEGADFSDYSTADHLYNYKFIGKGDGFVKEGYGTLLAHYRNKIPVKFNTIVNKIDWGGKEVKIETNQGTIKSKTCIVTVSIGVLKADKIKFIPSLPNEKYEAFNGIKLGLYNHIALNLKEEFYKAFDIQQDTYFFSKITTKSNSPKGFFGSLRLNNNNLSYFDVGGRFAKELEEEGTQGAIEFVLGSLRNSFGSNFDKYLLKAYATTWGKNEFFLGSYSSAKPGKAHLRHKLKYSVGNKIYFAGEALSVNYGTVHGADLSGIKVAKDILKFAKI